MDLTNVELWRSNFWPPACTESPHSARQKRRWRCAFLQNDSCCLRRSILQTFVRATAQRIPTNRMVVVGSKATSTTCAVSEQTKYNDGFRWKAGFFRFSGWWCLLITCFPFSVFSVSQCSGKWWLWEGFEALLSLLLSGKPTSSRVEWRMENTWQVVVGNRSMLEKTSWMRTWVLWLKRKRKTQKTISWLNLRSAF